MSKDPKKEKYQLDPKKRGRLPAWVLEAAGCKTKAAIVKKFGETATFTR